MFYLSNKGDLKFRIKLHNDDIQTLYYIKNLLSKLVGRKIGVIVNSTLENEAYYSIDKFQDIVEVIIPIFSYYPFTSFKYLDFLDFKSVASIKKIAYIAKRKLNFQELQDILYFKSRMNTKRTEFNLSLLPKRSLTPYRLLGFIEGFFLFT